MLQGRESLKFIEAEIKAEIETEGININDIISLEKLATTKKTQIT